MFINIAILIFYLQFLKTEGTEVVVPLDSLGATVLYYHRDVKLIDKLAIYRAAWNSYTDFVPAKACVIESRSCYISVAQKRKRRR